MSTKSKAKSGGSKPSKQEATVVPSLEQILFAEADRRQAVAFNREAALQKRIFADGFVPSSPEFEVQFGGIRYLAQRAEQLTSGEVRAYYAELGRWDQIAYLVLL